MNDPSRTRWVLPASPAPAEWRALREPLGLSGPLLTALWNRGVRSEAEARRFLHPQLSDLEDPYALSGMPRAAERLRQAVIGHERIFVFGDFDVDGLTSSVLASTVLGQLGAQVAAMVPNRLEDGFGLSVRAVEAARDFGARLLLAVDCGTSAHAAAARASELGIDLIVADHHVPDDRLPAMLALVNPRLEPPRYPFPDLAAVGVVYKILQAVTRGIGPEAETLLAEQLDLVALGTVADVVPLRGENRVFARLGLERMRDFARPGLQALAEQAEIEPGRLEALDLAFRIAPRLNAPGRLGSPERSLALLRSNTIEEARQRAYEVEADNRERRRQHERVLHEALRVVNETVDRKPRQAIVIGSAAWHPGVLGIAASRLAERFRVPVVLVSLRGPMARGSARTPVGIDLLALMRRAESDLAGFGGHPQAVGVSMRPDRFESFQRALAGWELAPEADHLASALALDAELDPDLVDLDLARQLEQIAPFGSGNEEPLFLGRVFCHHPRVDQGRHLRFRAGRGRGATDCIGFGMGKRSNEIPGSGAIVEVAYTPTVNRHRGEERLQLKIRALRLAGGADPVGGDGVPAEDDPGGPLES